MPRDPKNEPELAVGPAPGAPLSEVDARRLAERLARRGEGVAGKRQDDKAPKPQSIKTPGSRGRARKTRDGRELRTRTLYLPVELDRRLAVYCAELDAGFSETVAEAVAALLDKSRRRAG